MTRAVFLSSGGDPFITLFCLKLFKERWYAEADKFYICYNNHSRVPAEVVSEFLATAAKEPKVNLIYHPTGIGNGMPITEMTLIAKEDLVMLMEDDGFIFTLGVVDKQFGDIERDLCDAVGSARFSCGLEIGTASQKKYNLDYSGYGDVGPNFWPNFFFCKRKDLLATDLNFASVTFKEGEYSKELDHTFKAINHGDTFVWACIQLRAMGLRFHYVPQFHADPNEVESKHAGEMNWKFEKPYWIHGGSLSAGWGGYLGEATPDTSMDIAKKEIETRCAFWQIASDQTAGFDAFKAEYQSGIKKLIVRAGLDSARINQKINLYRELMQI